MYIRETISTQNFYLNSNFATAKENGIFSAIHSAMHASDIAGGFLEFRDHEVG